MPIENKISVLDMKLVSNLDGYSALLDKVMENKRVLEESIKELNEYEIEIGLEELS